MNPNKKLTLAAVCLACILVLGVAANAQVTAGLSANGRVMIHGDTINVCRGSTITYESVAQGSSLINWQFNNGAPGTMAGAGPFNITYNVNGYDTTYQWVGSGAFADSMFIIVRVADEKPVAGFDFSPDNVCGNETIQFTNTTVNGAPFSFVWYFGDNSTSVDMSPTHQYLDAVGTGTQNFPVKLVVTNANTCVDSITHNVTIRSVPDASMANADPAVTVGTYMDTVSFRTCNNEASYVFSFTNNSSTIPVNSVYLIKWGDGSPDTTFTSWPLTDTIRHEFPSGISSMSLSVTGTSGCIGVKNYIVYVGSFPYLTMTNTGSNEICEQDSLTFSLSNTAGNSPGTSYIFYINDFTEGQFFQHPNPATIGQRFTKNSCSYLSDDGSQVFTNALGAYMLVQNPCGVNSASVVPIYVSSKPKASIYTSSSTICAGSNINLINTSGYGNVITPTGGTDATCESKGKNVWTISPATGFTIAAGSTGSLNGNVANQAVWTDGSDSLDIQFNEPGMYTIRQYVGNERCGMDSVVTTICVRSQPVASFAMSREVSCGPAVVDLLNTSPANTCNTGTDEYLWTITYADTAGCAIPGEPSFAFVNGTDTSANPSISVHAAGLYIIQLMVRSPNAGEDCAEAFFTDTLYVKGPVTAALASLPVVCTDNAVSPSVSIAGCYSTGPYGYQWSFANGLPSASTDSLPGDIVFVQPGEQLIQLILTDSSCMQSDTVSTLIDVNPLPLKLTIDDTTICSGASLSLGGDAVPNATYQWSPATGLADPFVANPQLTLAYSGPATDTTVTYYVDYSSGEYCNKIDSVSIRVTRDPVITIDPGVAEICSGDSIVLTASGAATYTWDPASGLSNTTGASVIAKPVTNTVYNVTGITSAGCQAQQSIGVTVISTPVSSFDPIDVSVCGKDTIINFTAQTTAGDEGISYQWFVNDVAVGSTNPFSHHFQGSSAGVDQFTVRLQAQNGNGCGVTTLTGSVSLHPAPVPDIQVSPSLVQQQPNYEFTFRDLSQTTPDMIHTWTMGDRSMQTKNGQQVTYQYGDTGTYKVRLDLEDFATGCTGSDSVNVTILHVPVYIQVPNAICPGCSNQGVRKFLPLAKGLKKYRLTIYTSWGQKIFETTSLDADGSPNVPWDGTANGKPLQQDVYTWQIEGLFRNGTEWKGMIYPGKTQPVKAGFITVIK